MIKTLKDFFGAIVGIALLLFEIIKLFFLAIRVMLEPLSDIFSACSKKLVGTWRAENDPNTVIDFMENGRFCYCKDGERSEKSFHYDSTINHSWQVTNYSLSIRVTPSSANTFSYELKNNTLKLTCIKSDTLGYKSIFEKTYTKISNN